MLRRRNILQVTQAPPDNRIWLIKNGIEQTENTGGFYTRAGAVWTSGMSGWVATAPTMNQEAGYLNIKIQRSGAAVGCIMPGDFFPYSTVIYKRIYIDCDWTMAGNNAYWACLVLTSGGNYYSSKDVQKYETGERQTLSAYIGSYAENPEGVNALIQTSTRSESNLNIYNMWIE